MTKNKYKFYAVARGFKPGIYDSWSGEYGAKKQVKGFSNAFFKGFKTRSEAEEWYFDNRAMPTSSFEELLEKSQL